MDDLAAAEVLERAADLIIVDGWMQGGWGTPGGPRCADGHLQTACNERLGVQLRSMTFTELYSDCSFKTWKQLGQSHIDWNDKSGRTAGEVRDLFLNTAKDIRNGVDGATNPKEPSQ